MTTAPQQETSPSDADTPRGTSARRRGYLVAGLLVLVQSLLYGYGDPISKIAYETVPVFSLLFVRYSIALACLLVPFGAKALRELRGAPVSSWLVPSVCIASAFLLSNVSLDLTAATSTAFLRTLSTVMTPLLGLLVYRKGIRVRELPIYALAVGGLYLLCGHGGLSGFGWGEAAALLSALLAAGSLLFGEKGLRSISPGTLTTVQAATSVVFALVCALAFEGGVDVSGATAPVWWTIVYLAVTCTGAGFLLQNAAIKRSSSRFVALLQCMCPVMTALFSFAMLGERLTAAGLVGAGLIVASVAAEILAPAEDAEP